MSINVYLTGAEVEQDVTTASVAKVLTDASTSDIWANSTSLSTAYSLDAIFNVDWSLSNFVPFFQIQFDHTDEDTYAIFDNAAATADPDPASDFDVNVTYRINGGAAPSSSAGFFDTNSVNLYHTPIEGTSGALSTDASEIAGATLPAVFAAHGYETATDHTPKNLYLSDLAEDLFGNAGTVELLSNEKTIGDEITTAGVSLKNKLDNLISDQNSSDNSLANKTGKNNSTLIVGKLLRAMMKNEFVNSDGDTVDTAARVNAALAKWKAHGTGATDNEITDDDGNSYTIWESNSNGADYFNLGSCLRVGEQLRMRVKFTVNSVAHGTPGPTVFSAVDSNGAAENRTHNTKIHEFRINLKAD
jgi:hypothetical protein